ncbi:MAG: hypothetical protein ACRCVN_00845 [Spirochaetia bacterium]
MNSKACNWRKGMTQSIEASSIGLLFCQLGVCGFSTGILLGLGEGTYVDWKERILIYLFSLWFVSNALVILIFACILDKKPLKGYATLFPFLRRVDKIQIEPILSCYNIQQIPNLQMKIIWIYSFAVIFFILSNTALAILYKDNWQTFLRVFLFLGGGATLPILVYCAQFLFRPRPRLRFISSLFLLPACVLWVWVLFSLTRP